MFTYIIMFFILSVLYTMYLSFIQYKHYCKLLDYVNEKFEEVEKKLNKLAKK